jgi:hypothetical protein
MEGGDLASKERADHWPQMAQISQIRTGEVMSSQIEKACRLKKARPHGTVRGHG